MENREFDLDDPIIFCSHNFDISNRKKFVTDLATRLGANINIMQGFDDEIMDTVKIPNATITKNLRYPNPKIETDYEYALVHGDEFHLFSDNYLKYNLPFIMDYEQVIDTLKIESESNGDDDEYIIVDDLKKFGATEVHINKLKEVNLTDDEIKD